MEAQTLHEIERIKLHRKSFVVRDRFIKPVTGEPADRKVYLRFAHQLAVMDKTVKKTGKHQTESGLRVYAGTAVS